MASDTVGRKYGTFLAVRGIDGNIGLGMVAGALSAIGVSILGVMAVPEEGRADPQGVRWDAELTVDEALARAREQDKRVLLEFTAGWCTVCETLDEQVLSTRLGGELTADMIAVKVDFDAPENRPLVERYVVLGLPTVIVMTGDGAQVGRLMGFETREAWVRELRAAKTATDPIPGLRAELEASPGDPARALALGEALLVRGETDEGEALLERVTWMDDAEKGAQALFLLGRYHHRVRRDPRTARHVWRELATRFPQAEYAGGAWWWYAKAQAELNQKELGWLALRDRLRSTNEAGPESIDAAEQLAEYTADQELRAHDDEARRALEAALTRAPADRQPALRELAARLQSR